MPSNSFRKLLLAALACAAVPGLAAAAGKPAAVPVGTSWIAGIWESPWRPDQPHEGDPRPRMEVGPPPLKPQYLEAWQAQQKKAADAAARGEPLGANGVECLPDGFPTMMWPTFPVEVLATPRQINITNEAYNQVRRIYIGEKLIPIEDAEPGFFGHSVGHWQGKTLVVDTIGVKDRVRLRGAPHSPNMRIRERMYPTGPDTFEDEITITDEEYLAKPWTFTYHYKRRLGYKMNEYVCEHNREYIDPNTGAQRLNLGN